MRALPSNSEEWIRPKDLAMMLSTTVGALASQRHRGNGPKFSKAGGSIRYRTGDVKAWLEDNVKDAT